MDIRRLVNRITEALGPDADPARIEAVAAAVLDVFDTDPAAPPTAPTAKTPGVWTLRPFLTALTKPN